jgi:hypothetical protein
MMPKEKLTPIQDYKPPRRKQAGGQGGAAVLLGRALVGRE